MQISDKNKENSHGTDPLKQFLSLIIITLPSLDFRVTSYLLMIETLQQVKQLYMSVFFFLGGGGEGV